MRLESSGNLGVGFSPGFTPPPMRPTYECRRQSSVSPLILWLSGAMFGFAVSGLVQLFLGGL
jgi:hypothetical protein